jgi:GAF domain-containing protein
MIRAVRLLHEISGRLDRGELDSHQFLRDFTRTLCRTIGCSHTGVWVFSDAAAERTLRCLARYEAPGDRMVPADDMVESRAGPYFEILERDGHVIAPDARCHPATSRLLAGAGTPPTVRSMLDVSFAVNGVKVGIFRCEQVGEPMEWSGNHLQLLRAVGPRAALSLVRGQHRPLDTAPGALWEPRDAARRMTRTMPLHN